MKITGFTKGYEEVVSRIIQKNLDMQWPEPFSREEVVVLKEYATPEYVLKCSKMGLTMIALDGDKVTGTGALFPETNEISRVYIDPERHREGIGTKIMKRLESRALKKYGLDFIEIRHVTPDDGVISFYSSLGYEKKGCLFLPLGGISIFRYRMRKALKE